MSASQTASRQLRRRAGWITTALYLVFAFGLLCLGGIGSVTWAASHRWWAEDHALAAETPPVSTDATSEAAAKGALDLYEKRLADQERVIDKLAALTGLYTLLVGAAAFVGLFQARAKAEADLKALESRVDAIRADVPSVYALSRRVEDVLARLSLQLPAEKNWSDARSYEALSPEAREQVLLAEITIGAMELFDLEASPLMKLRLADISMSLARFYYGRSGQPGLPAAEVTADRARASQYLERVITLGDARRHAVACRLRGVMAMDEVEAIPETAPAAEARRRPLIRHALYWLDRAVETDGNEAGAYYNRAYIYGVYQAQPERAVAELEGMVARRADFDPSRRAKFLPVACMNLACFRLAVDSAALPQALRDCRLGKEIALECRVLEEFLKDLEDELGRDLLPLAQTCPEEVQALLQRDEKPRPKGWRGFLERLGLRVIES